MSTDKKMFEYMPIEPAAFKEAPELDLPKLYEQACSELALQQSKRDVLINIYLVIFSFLVPLTFSLEHVTLMQKGTVLMASGIIGILFSIIIIRYRIYKEAYWHTCFTITQMTNLKTEALTKKNVQSLYYECLNKKWRKYVNIKNGKKSFKRWKIFCDNIFSAESLYYVVIAFLTSVVTGIGLYLILVPLPSWKVYITIAAAIMIFIWLIWFYFRSLKNVYAVLVDDTSDSFNFAFGKAWFLHFYRDQE